MTEDAILTEVRNGVLIVTMNRPEAKNAISQAMAEGVGDAMDRLDSDPDIRVGVLTGAGGTFCAGMDLKAFARGERPVLRNKGFAGLVKAPPKKPLIAAVEGYALAGGFEIALSCDLVVAGKGAKFGLPEVKRGLTAAAGGLFRLPRRIPYSVAMELILTGRMWEAEDAAAVGFLSRLTESGGALDAAVELAEEIAVNAPLSLMASKQVVVESAGWAPEDAFSRQESIVDPVRQSADAKEGALAFVEKRAPVWQGR